MKELPDKQKTFFIHCVLYNKVFRMLHAMTDVIIEWWAFFIVVYVMFNSFGCESIFEPKKNTSIFKTNLVCCGHVNRKFIINFGQSYGSFVALDLWWQVLTNPNQKHIVPRTRILTDKFQIKLFLLSTHTFDYKVEYMWDYGYFIA